MISKEKILNLASNFAPAGMIDVIKKAYDATQGVMNAAQSPEDALKRAGIGSQDLEKIRKYTDHPLANIVLSAFGMKSADMRGYIDKIRGNDVSSVSSASEDELEKLRKHLDLLKRG